MNPRLRAVVFDSGGVLTAPMDGAFAAWLLADGVDRAHFAAVMAEWLGLGPDRITVVGAAVDSPVHAIERGQLSPASFELALAAALAARGSTVVADGLLRRMLAGLDALDPEMIELVREVRRRGARTALLSNSWGEHYPAALFEGLFDAVVISGREGLRKPEPAIFALVADRLGVETADCLLVDDLGVNVEGARRAGMAAMLHTSVEATRSALLAAVPMRDTPGFSVG